MPGLIKSQAGGLIWPVAGFFLMQSGFEVDDCGNSRIHKRSDVQLALYGVWRYYPPHLPPQLNVWTRQAAYKGVVSHDMTRPPDPSAEQTDLEEVDQIVTSVNLVYVGPPSGQRAKHPRGPPHETGVESASPWKNWGEALLKGPNELFCLTVF